MFGGKSKGKGKGMGHQLKTWFKERVRTRGGKSTAAAESTESHSGTTSKAFAPVASHNEQQSKTSILMDPVNSTAIQIDPTSSSSVSTGNIGKNGPQQPQPTAPVPASGPVLVPVVPVVSQQTGLGIEVDVNTRPSSDPDLQGNKDALIQKITDAQKRLAQVQETWVHIDRHGKQINVGARMRKILRGIEDCAKIVDVAVQHSPEITALIWAGTRFILMIALNRVHYIDNLDAAMALMIEKIATCEFYAQIYDEALKIQLSALTTTSAFKEGLDSAIKKFYAAVQALVDKAMEYFDTTANVFANAINLMKPFDVSMQPLIQDIIDKENTVKGYAEMATMQKIKGNSEKLRDVEEVIKNIERELKPLAKMDEVLHVINKVKDELVEFRLEVVRDLLPHQGKILQLVPQSLDAELQTLRQEYLDDFQQEDIFQRTLYVPTRGMDNQHTPEEEHFNLEERLNDFLAPTTLQKLCLLQGAAGSGKSTFNHYLARKLWGAYSQASANATPAIPVFITLANLHDPSRRNQDLIAAFFRQRGWPEDKIVKAKNELQFVFILDGYDEIEKRDRNFYVDNMLSKWDAKTVITSRPEYLGSGYRSKFHPPGQPNLLQEFWLAPFSTQDIRDYISKYIQLLTMKDPSEAGRRSMETYKQLIEQPELRILMSNPFLLRMVMTVQPSIEDTQLSRLTLYQKFLHHWVDTAHKRLIKIQLPSGLSDLFTALDEGNFVERVMTFCLDFAVELYRQKLIEASYIANPGRSPSKIQQNTIWKQFLTPEDPLQRLLRWCSPLTRMGTLQYRFLHKSLRDYAVAQALCEGVGDIGSEGGGDSLLNEFNIIEDPGVIDFMVEAATNNKELQTQLLSWVETSKRNSKVARGAANAITILVRAGKQFHQYDLRDIRVPEADLRAGWFEGTQLQGADLSRANLSCVWLRGADLSGACFEGCWFGERPYFKPDIRALQAGQTWFPQACFYDSVGKLIVASTYLDSLGPKDNLEIWSVSDGKVLGTLKIKHIFGIDSLAFATAQGPRPGTQRIFFAYSATSHIPKPSEQKIRVWSILELEDQQFETDIHTLPMPMDKDSATGRALGVIDDNTVTITTDAKFLGAAGGDIRRVYDPSVSQYIVACLWSLTTYEVTILVHKSFPDQSVVNSVAYSSNLEFLAISVIRGTTPDSFYIESEEISNAFLDVHLWSITIGGESETCEVKTLNTLPGMPAGERYFNCAIAFAPNNYFMACTDGEGCLNLWSVQDTQLIHRFDTCGPERLSYYAARLAFAPDSQLLAMQAYAERPMQIWSVGSRKLVHVIHGISPGGYRFSMDGQVVAGITRNLGIRQWLVPQESKRLYPAQDLRRKTIEGYATHIAFSSDMKLLAVAVRDGVQIFSIERPHAPQRISTYSHELKGACTELFWVRFSRNNKLLAMSTNGGKIGLLPLDQDYLTLDDTNIWTTVPTVLMDNSGNGTYNPIGIDFAPTRTGLLAHKSSVDGIISQWSVETDDTHAFKLEPYMSVNDGTPDFEHSNPPCIEFSPDSQLLVTGLGWLVEIWSVDNCTLIHTYEGHTESVESVIFSPDGQKIASGSRDHSVRLWSVSELQAVHVFQGHTGFVSALAFSPDGFLLASGSDDHTIRIWSLNKKELILVINAQSEIETLAWGCSSDGDLMGIVTRIGSVQLYQIIKKAGYCASKPVVEISCLWATDQGDILNVSGARMQGVTGLNAEHVELLRQRGAVGEPGGLQARILPLEDEGLTS